MAATTPTKTPYKQIRALYDDETVTVYQAYKASIAKAAVEHQKLNASPAFSTSRMTWIKPSWAWMLYRAGYSYKDARQERILALRMRREDFLEILKRGSTMPVVGGGAPVASESGAETTAPAADESEDKQVIDEDTSKGRPFPDKKKDERGLPEVRIQWDPERTVRLDRLDYRSIQIGIPAGLSERWTEEMIVGIEDVTDKARELKRVLDEDEDISLDELIEKGLVPVERPFELPEELQRGLGMIRDDISPAPAAEE